MLKNYFHYVFISFIINFIQKLVIAVCFIETAEDMIWHFDLTKFIIAFIKIIVIINHYGLK